MYARHGHLPLHHNDLKKQISKLFGHYLHPLEKTFYLRTWRRKPHRLQHCCRGFVRKGGSRGHLPIKKERRPSRADSFARPLDIFLSKSSCLACPHTRHTPVSALQKSPYDLAYVFPLKEPTAFMSPKISPLLSSSSIKGMNEFINWKIEMRGP